MIYRRIQKEDELLHTVWSLVTVREPVASARGRMEGKLGVFSVHSFYFRLFDVSFAKRERERKRKLLMELELLCREEKRRQSAALQKGWHDPHNFRIIRIQRNEIDKLVKKVFIIFVKRKYYLYKLVTSSTANNHRQEEKKKRIK